MTSTDAPSTPPTGSITYPRWLWVVGGVVVVVVAAAVTLLIVLGGPSSPDQPGGAVEALLPTSNSQLPQQGSVGIDLAPGYDAELTVNGVPLPVDQVVAEKGLNTFVFRPGPDKEFEFWPAGQNCVTARFWPTANPGSTETRTWCFTVV